MNLQDLYTTVAEKYGYQMVLSFSNNNDVLITKEDFNPNSKFVRRSRVRLGEDFLLSGIYIDQFGQFYPSSAFPDKSSEKDALIYRANRGKQTDYIVYLYYGEHQVIETLRKKCSRKTIKKYTSHVTGTPDKDEVLNIFIDSNSVTYKNKHLSIPYVSKPSNGYFTGYYQKFINAMYLASKYSNMNFYKVVRIHLEQAGKGAYNCLKYGYNSKRMLDYQTYFNTYRQNMLSNGVELIVSIE